MAERTIHLLMGLPGSGKTTWAKKYKKSHSNDNYIIIEDFDQLLSINRYKNMYEIIKDRIPSDVIYLNSYDKNNRTIILDGLFCTSSEAEYVINAWLERSNEVYNTSYKNNRPHIKFVIHRWEPDVETCLWNDEGRREESSALTIKNMKMDNIDINALKEKYDNEYFTLHIENHFVVRATPRDKFMFKYGDQIKSESWTTGGHWGNCWGDEGEVGAEPEVSFIELDKILEEYWPDITYLKYKIFSEQFVHKENKTDYGYYGSYEYYSYWYVNTGDLYDFLHENDKI